MHGEMWAILAGSWVAEVGRGRIGGDVVGKGAPDKSRGVCRGLEGGIHETHSE